MRLDTPSIGTTPTLVLSERNLLALLTKLYTEGSAVMIEGGSDCPLNVRAEHDEVHYGDRPPGQMHPVTEQLITLVRAATRNASLSDSKTNP